MSYDDDDLLLDILAAAVLGGGPTFNGNSYSAYSLLDIFDDARTAGAVNGTLPVVGGARVVTDTNSKLSIVGGVASFATGGVGFGDPGLWYASAVRAFGRTLVGSVNIASGLGGIGWDTAALGLFSESITPNGASLEIRSNSAAVAVGLISLGATYQFAIVLRSSGTYYFIKGGAFTNWTLLFATSTISTTPMLPGAMGSTNSVFTADNLRVPASLYTVPQLAYDSFTTSLTAVDSSGQGNDGTHVAVGLDGN